MESFSVVDSMPMITVEAEEGTGTPSHIVVTDEGAGGKTDTEGMARIIEGGHIITNGSTEEGGHSTTRIIHGTQIFTSESGHMIASDTGQLITSGHAIFSDSGSDIITTESGHIIMEGDGSGGILHAGGQVITEDGKARLVSSNGDVIEVDSSLLDASHTLPSQVTEVMEETEDRGEHEEEEEDEDDMDDGKMLQRIKKEPSDVDEDEDDDDTASSIQIQVNPSAPRPKDTAQHAKMLADSKKAVNELIKSEKQNRYTKVDRDDPRSRLHFVKYMKRDGKTVKIWECGICGKEFMHQYTLMRHLPTHTDERNYRCNQCGKAFRQMSTLSQHKATHSESRPYVCHLCQKTFSRVSTLISHKKTHTEEKQHQCHICGKAFHQKGNLKNHLFTHTNERPYKCHICGRGFNQSSNLQCHKAKAHADGTLLYQYIADKYKCNYCDLAFSRRAQLRQHEEYKHGVRYVHGSRSASGGRARILGHTSNILRKKKIGNVRIIQLPNGDRTFQEIGTNDNLTRHRKIKSKSNVKNGILIEPIDTKAMHQALAAGRTPFALLKPTKGVPVLVKVQFALGSKHMLVPATASELRSASKFTVSSHQSGAKAVQIKVPVVATVIQRVDENGQVHMDIEAPDEEEDEEEEQEQQQQQQQLEEEDNSYIVSNLGSQQQRMKSEESSASQSIMSTTVSSNMNVNQRLIMNPAVVQTSITEPVMEGEEEEEEEATEGGTHSLETPMAPSTEDGIIISAMGDSDALEYSLGQQTSEETGEEISSVDLLATAVNLVSQAQINKDGMTTMEGIQYLRQVNFREYEMVPPNHAQATHFINQQGDVEQIKMDEESSSAVSMEHANITAFMDALQSAGYSLGTGNQQIIINADGDAMVVDQQQVQMVMDGEMEGVVGDSVDPSVNLVVHEVPEGIQSVNPDGTNQ